MFPAASSMEADTLATLALKAATQIDRIERNKNSDLQAITKFVEAMTPFFGGSENVNSEILYLDPLSSEMLSAAVKSATAQSIDSIDELTRELRKVTAEMKELSNVGSEKAALKRFKSFCLFIHDFVLKNRIGSGLNEKGVFDYDHSFAG